MINHLKQGSVNTHSWIISLNEGRPSILEAALQQWGPDVKISLEIVLSETLSGFLRSVFRVELPTGEFYSHSIVPGGFEVISYTTLPTPATSFIILLDRVWSRSNGRLDASTVMASVDSTALIAMTFS